MKFCQPHWNELRKALADKGMGELGAKSGADAIERVKEELEGTATDVTFDPLMACNWQIVQKVCERLPYVLIEMKPDGEHYCPLCEAEVHTHPSAPTCAHPGLATDWIKGCTDAMLEHCREKGLVPKVQ